METVLVQLPSDDDRRAPPVLALRPGTTVTFGRGAPGCPVSITLPHDGVSRLAGEITAAEDYWLLSNLSRTKTYVVENPEGAGEYVKVPPRRLGAPVPFEFARLVLPVGDGFVHLKVFAPAHTYAEDTAMERLEGERTTSAFALDETAKYFLILLALCEPRLRDSSTVALPTVGVIVDRLRPLESCQALTRAAVNYHIDYPAPSCGSRTPRARPSPHGWSGSARPSSRWPSGSTSSVRSIWRCCRAAARASASASAST